MGMRGSMFPPNTNSPSVTLDVTGELIVDDEATIRSLLAQQ